MSLIKSENVENVSSMLLLESVLRGIKGAGEKGSAR